MKESEGSNQEDAATEAAATILNVEQRELDSL